MPVRVPGKSGYSIKNSDFCFIVIAFLAGHEETYSDITEGRRFVRSSAFPCLEGN